MNSRFLIIAQIAFALNGGTHFVQAAEPPQKKMAWILVHNKKITRGPVRAILVYGGDNSAKNDAMKHIDSVLMRKVSFVSANIADTFRILDWKKVESGMVSDKAVKIVIKYQDETYWVGHSEELTYKAFRQKLVSALGVEP